MQKIRKMNILRKVTFGAILLLFVLVTLQSTSVNAEVSGFYKYVKNSDDTLTIIKYTGAEQNLTVPSKLDGKKVTAIDNQAFANNKYIEEVTVPGTINKIEKEAFFRCEVLAKVTLKEGVTTIMPEAFYGCASLKTVAIPDSVTSIPESCFSNCTKLSSISLGKGITSIEEGAFWYCESLTDITLPDNLQFLGALVFGNCTALKSIEIPDSVVTIENREYPDRFRSMGDGGSACFLGCTSLESVKIGNQVTTIGGGMFYQCTSLKMVEIGDKIKVIDDYAFEFCESLISLKFKAPLEKIGKSAFYQCTSLSEVDLPNTIKSIGASAFTNCTSIQTFEFPRSMRECVSFSGCTNLKSVTIPNDIIKINYEIVDAGQDVIIYGYQGSVAEQKCIEYKNKFVALEAIPATDLSFDSKEISLNQGDTYQLEYQIKPSNSTDGVIWESSSSSIATVDDWGNVTAKNEGSASIIATTTGGKRSTITVIVSSAPKQLTFKTSSKTIALDQNFTQKAVVDRGRNDVSVTYASSNPEIATVSVNGKVTAKKTGTVNIKATTYNGLEVSYVLTIKKAPTTLTVKDKSIILLKGKSIILQPSVGKESYASYTYKTSNAAVATVSKSGKIIAKKAGTVTITITTHN